MTNTKVKNLISLLIITFSFFACGNRPKDFKYVIDKIEAYKKQNNEYPSSLDQIEVKEKNLCYYLDGGSFSLEFVNGNDLYWYNSGNEVWDFLESDADRFYCK